MREKKEKKQVEMKKRLLYRKTTNLAISMALLTSFVINTFSAGYLKNLFM